MTPIIIEIIRQKKIMFAVILLLFLLNAALIVLTSYYQSSELAVAQVKWSDLRRKNASAGHVDSSVLYRQGLSDLEKLKANIPAKHEFGRVLSELLEAASASGVTVGSITYKPTVIKEEGLLSYQLSFPVAGGYAAIKSYLADLQNNSGLLVVDDVVFSNSDPFVEKVVMDLHLTVYLRGGV